MGNNTMKSRMGIAGCSLLVSEVVSAHRASYGSMAHSLMGPMQAIITMLHIACMFAGIGLSIGAFVRYFGYRRNPSEVTLGFIFVQVVAGLALIALSFLPFMTSKH